MTNEQLINRRDEISFELIEANSDEVANLEQELYNIEAMLNAQMEFVDEEV